MLCSILLRRHSSICIRTFVLRWQSTTGGAGSCCQELLVNRCADHNITTLTLNRPKANAMGQRLMAEFESAMDELEGCQETRCVILTSFSTKVFSAGADLKERASMSSLGDVETVVTGLRSSLQRFASLPMPTIAVIEGVALGGGMELAAAADIRIASRSAIFGLPETSLGIVPGAGGTQRIPRLIGVARALELILTGQRVNGETAYAYGIVQHLVEPGEADKKALE
jgi:methylglutaconyl-CoA hydratase